MDIREKHEMTGHGVTLTIELVSENNYLRFIVTANRFRAVIPHCGCDRKACVGPGVWGRTCKEADRKGAAGFTHTRDFCHAFGHIEYVEVYAREVLERFGPKGGKHTPPRVRRTDYRMYRSSFVPLNGEHAVVIVPRAHYDKREVICDSARCRDENGKAKVLLETANLGEATRARDKHIEWHKQLGVHPRVELDQWIAKNTTVTTPELAEVPA